MHRKQHLYSHFYRQKNEHKSTNIIWTSLLLFFHNALVCPTTTSATWRVLWKKKYIYICIFKYVYVDTCLWVGTRKIAITHTHTSFFKNIFLGTSHQIINITTATLSIASVFWTFLNQHPTFIQLRFFGLLDGEASTHGPLCPWHQKKPARRDFWAHGFWLGAIWHLAFRNSQ